MKIKFLLIILLLLFSLGTGVLAQDTKLPDPGSPAVELPKAGLTPNSSFYFLEKMTEGIGTFFTFGDIRKAKRYANLAAERLAEAKAVVEKGKPELVEKTLARYEDQLNKSIARAEKAQAKGKSTEKVIEVMTKIGNRTAVHLEVLAEIHEKVPEQAKPAIEKAMGVSVKGHEKAVKVLKEKNALGEIPEKISLPEVVPQEARERIQMKVQQGLMIEKALQNPESPRDLCTRMGGPSEVCEKIPLGGFDSFKDIENFCTETGGPPEYCMTIESKCKEFGVTIPDECFRVISIAALETYNSVELTTRPVPSMTEEEMKEMEKKRQMEKETAIDAELDQPEDDITKCEVNEMIFYTNSSGCVHCEKVVGDGTISKIEELGVKVTRIDTEIGPVEHKLLGIPSFVINDKVYMGYKTFKELSELLVCK